jgi:hypothetical protein
MDHMGLLNGFNKARHWWLTPVRLMPTWEAEIGRSWFEASLGK